LGGQWIPPFSTGFAEVAGSLSHSLVSFTTIDFPGAADTVEPPSSVLYINPEGQIVGGYLDTSGTGHGFLLSHGTFTTIDFPGSIYTEANRINSKGDIVGAYVDANFVPPRLPTEPGQFQYN
jgi:hypothetical protein